MSVQQVTIWQVVAIFLGGAVTATMLLTGHSPANSFSGGSVVFILSFLIVMAAAYGRGGRFTRR